MFRHAYARSRISRLFLSVFLASGLTVSLFLMMRFLVEVKEVTLSENPYRPMLTVVTPKEEDPTYDNKDTFKVEKLEAAHPPRRESRLVTSETVITFDVPQFSEPSFSVPVELIKSVGAPSVSVERKQAIPVRQPKPDYPPKALRQGLEGDCEVVFSIDAAGRPYNVNTDCSHPVFESSSKRAVQKALFAARVENGIPMGDDNLVYPVSFRLNE